MSNDNSNSAPNPTTERTQTSEIRLAQPIESTNEHENESADREGEVEEWIRYDPFSEGMRRLTLGTIGTGKTVGAMATASRVLDTVPGARIVIFDSIPGEYDSLAHTLSEKNRDTETGDIPSAKRFRVGNGEILSPSASDLPAVSIIEPPESAALPECQEPLEQAVEDFVGELSSADEKWPTYLILDEADWIFRSESAFGFNEMIQAQEDHGALAVQVVAQKLDDGRLEAGMGCGEDVQHPSRLFDTFDLYYLESPTLRKRFGLSSQDAEFLRGEATPGFAGGNDEQRVPTGLCQTPDEDWQRVRYPLTDYEVETLLERQSDSYQQQRDTATEAGGI